MQEPSTGTQTAAPSPAEEAAPAACWEQVRLWRRERRAELLTARVQAGRRRRAAWAEAIEPQLRAVLGRLSPGIIGFYWPFKGEFDARGLVQDLCAEGWRCALPAVVEPRTPLEFRAWAPGEPLEPGIWKIPVPAQRRVVVPSVLLVPLVGFDPARYRLGYGGGYYDRTLASLAPRPLAVGVGFEQGRLATIQPQAHDIPMDLIVTEDGSLRR